METNLLEKPVYGFAGNFYCDIAWKRLNAKRKEELVPNMVYTISNPIVSLDANDAVKCHKYGSLLGPQLFEKKGVYETLLETYLSTASSSLATTGTLKKGLVSPDTIYALVLVNHVNAFSNINPSQISMHGVIKILLQIKVQMVLNNVHNNWCKTLKIARESHIPVPFPMYVNFLRKWEILIGDEHLLSSLSNANRPINPILEIDFICNRARIYSKIDQVIYELRLQEESYNKEDVGELLTNMSTTDNLPDFEKRLDTLLSDTDFSNSSDDFDSDFNEGFDLPESDFS